MARRQEILNFEIYIGDTPIEALTKEEREDFADRVVQRMGETLNNHYSVHPEEYKRLKPQKPLRPIEELQRPEGATI